jgi:hypothetical protein
MREGVLLPYSACSVYNISVHLSSNTVIVVYGVLLT